MSPALLLTIWIFFFCAGKRAIARDQLFALTQREKRRLGSRVRAKVRMIGLSPLNKYIHSYSTSAFYSAGFEAC